MNTFVERRNLLWIVVGVVDEAAIVYCLSDLRRQSQEREGILFEIAFIPWVCDVVKFGRTRHCERNLQFC